MFWKRAETETAQDEEILVLEEDREGSARGTRSRCTRKYAPARVCVRGRRQGKADEDGRSRGEAAEKEERKTEDASGGVV